MITKEEFDSLYPKIDEEIKSMYKDTETPVLKFISIDKTKTLIQIGTNHSRNKENKQFEIILKELKKEKPNCAIFESSAEELSILKTETKEEREKYHGELGIIYNYLNKKTKKIGADLEFFDSIDKLSKQNFTQDEIDAYKVFSFMITEIILYKHNLEDAINNACKHTKVLMNDNIRKMMNAHALVHNKKSLNELTASDDLTICPLFKNDSLSKVARKVSKLRDFNIVNVTLEALEKYSKVMLFTGLGHIIRHKKIFEKYLGVEKIIN